MIVSVLVTLGEGETFAGTPEWAAQNVLAALGGNPAKDFCTTTIAEPPPPPGEAGTPPEPPPPG